MALIKTAAQIMSGYRMPPGWVPPPPEAKRGRPPNHVECTLADCDSAHHAHGLCRKHLKAMERWGDPYHVYVRGRFGRCACQVHAKGEVGGAYQDR